MALSCSKFAALTLRESADTTVEQGEEPTVMLIMVMMMLLWCKLCDAHYGIWLQAGADPGGGRAMGPTGPPPLADFFRFFFRRSKK